MTNEETKEILERLRQLTWTSRRLEEPDIDWIRPECETDEQILTEIQYQATLSKALLQRHGIEINN